MNSEHLEDDPGQKSWLSRITQAFSSSEPQTQQQLWAIIKQSCQKGIIDAESVQMLDGVFKVADMRVRDIMIPRAQMVVLHRDNSLTELISQVISSGHSRFPIIGENLDEIMGILLAKDLLRYCTQTEKKYFSLEHHIRPVMFIPESKRLNVLLKEFRQNRNHMAIVVDEYGGISGLVTIEDVLEQIVGEIDDEHDLPEEVKIIPMKDKTGSYIVDALTELTEFNQYFSADFSDEDSDTVGGLIIHTLGYLPQAEDELDIMHFHFKVLRADKRRLYSLEVSPKTLLPPSITEQ